MLNRVSLGYGLSVLVALTTLPVLAEAQEESTQDASSVWVTSIAPIGESGDFVAATADGLLLREAQVFSFEAARPNQLKPLYEHPAAVWAVDSTSDGKTIASVDYRGNLVVFDHGKGEATTHQGVFERWCQAMLISPDDKAVVAGNEAGKILVWDIAGENVSKSVELEGQAVTGLAFSPDASQLAVTDGGGTVHLWKWPQLESIGKIKVSDQATWCVAFVEGGNAMLVGSSDRHLYRCEAKPDAKPQSVTEGTDWITQLAVSPGGVVAAGEVGGKLHFPSGGGTDSMDATSGVWTLCWNGDGQIFAGTRKDGIVMASRSWKWTEPAPPQEKEPAEADEPAEAEEAADGKQEESAEAEDAEAKADQ